MKVDYPIAAIVVALIVAAVLVLIFTDQDALGVGLLTSVVGFMTSRSVRLPESK